MTDQADWTGAQGVENFPGSKLSVVTPGVQALGSPFTFGHLAPPVNLTLDSQCLALCVILTKPSSSSSSPGLTVTGTTTGADYAGLAGIPNPAVSSTGVVERYMLAVNPELDPIVQISVSNIVVADPGISVYVSQIFGNEEIYATSNNRLPVSIVNPAPIGFMLPTLRGFYSSHLNQAFLGPTNNSALAGLGLVNGAFNNVLATSATSPTITRIWASVLNLSAAGPVQWTVSLFDGTTRWYVGALWTMIDASTGVETGHDFRLPYPLDWNQIGGAGKTVFLQIQPNQASCFASAVMDWT